MISFFVAGLAQTKGSWRCVGRGRFIPDNPDEVAWSHLVAWEAKQAMSVYFAKTAYAQRQPFECQVMVSLAFILPRPIGRKYKRDIDKLARSCLDSMTGICYKDDELVSRLEADKMIAERGHGVRVHIEPWKPRTN